MNYVRLIAPAKVNLVLAVGQRREDGFHAVDTIMHALALHDVLTMRLIAEDEGGLQVELACELTGGVELDIAPEQNLAYKAVLALAQALDRTQDETISIQLEKSIPAQAGLGGGSSDAAAALLGAATLWDVPANDPRLLEVAAQLGSDVAYFLHGGCVLLSGKGEKLVSRLQPRKDFCVIIRPEGGVSTGAAYAAFDENPQLPSPGYVEGLAALTDAAQVECFNNLAPASAQLLPELSVVAEWVAKQPGVTDSVLCGSGSATAALCSGYDAAVALSVAARKQGWRTRVTSLSRMGAAVVESY